MKTLIQNARVICSGQAVPTLQNVLVENGKIIEISQNRSLFAAFDGIVIDAKGLYLSAGFIDTHTHGAGNHDFMDGSPEAVAEACRTHLRYGTTSILPTTLSSRMDELYDNLGNIEQAAKIRDRMPNILGIHLEGPYFSPAQSGAQDPRYLKPPDPAEYLRILDEHPSIVKWTVAPELPGALEMGRALRERGVVASIGHTDADDETVVQAIQNGYRMVTHLFNAMSRLTRKNALMTLGVAESGLLHRELTVEVIADGKHLPPALLRLIYQAKGPDRICLVTDSMRAAGVQTTESIIGSLANGQRVEVEDGVAYMPGRKSFGGSVCTADRLVRTMVQQAGVPLSEAVEMLTLTPARTLGIDRRKGSVENGKDADLILFDEGINIQMVMVMGNIWLNQLAP